MCHIFYIDHPTRICAVTVSRQSMQFSRINSVILCICMVHVFLSVSACDIKATIVKTNWDPVMHGRRITVDKSQVK